MNKPFLHTALILFLIAFIEFLLEPLLDRKGFGKLGAVFRTVVFLGGVVFLILSVL